MKDALDETLMLTDKYGWFCCRLSMNIDCGLVRIIKKLVAKIIGDAGALYKASEAVSPYATVCLHCMQSSF